MRSLVESDPLVVHQRGEGVVRVFVKKPGYTSFRGASFTSLTHNLDRSSLRIAVEQEESPSLAAIPSCENECPRLSFFYEGVCFLEDSSLSSYSFTSSEFKHSLKLPNGPIFGCGEASGELDRKFRTFKIDATDAMGYSAKTSDPLYKHAPLWFSVCETARSVPVVFCVVYDTYSRGELDLGNRISAFRGRTCSFTVQNDSFLDYYICAGRSFPEVSRKLMNLIGRPCLPPSWALGYSGSAMNYTEHPTDAEKNTKLFVDECREKSIPIQSFHLSSGYCLDEQTNSTRHVFEWNHNKFPKPDAFCRDMRGRCVEVVPNVKPWLLESHPKFEESKDLLLRHGGVSTSCVSETSGARPTTPPPAAPPSSSPERPRSSRKRRKKKVDGDSSAVSSTVVVHTGWFWRGGDGAYAKGAYLDFTNPKTQTWWKTKIRTTLGKCRAIWNDNNEFEVDDGKNAVVFDGTPVDDVGRAFFSVLMARCSYQALWLLARRERLNTTDEDESFGFEFFESDAVLMLNPTTHAHYLHYRAGREREDQQHRAMAQQRAAAMHQAPPVRADEDNRWPMQLRWRPLVVSRSGGLGTHRYAAQTWSGDNTTSWETLKYNIPMALSLGLCGWVGNGFDVGGFAGGAPSKELFLRWVQIGIWFPRFSIHSSAWKRSASSESHVNEPWMFPEISTAVKNLLLGRARLKTYLMSLHLKAYESMAPIARMLAYHYPTDPKVRTESFRFLVGEDVLVCPFVERALPSVYECYFPEPSTGLIERWAVLECESEQMNKNNTTRFESGTTFSFEFSKKEISTLLVDVFPTYGCLVFIREGRGIPLRIPDSAATASNPLPAAVRDNEPLCSSTTVLLVETSAKSGLVEWDEEMDETRMDTGRRVRCSLRYEQGEQVGATPNLTLDLR